MTIAFLSLFFGLITGPYPIEMSVNGPVAAVELRVDGQTVRRLERSPWKTEVDFGPALLPHEVTARALDAAGREIARARDWVNLPHPLARVDLRLEGEAGRPPRAARVVWTNLKGEKPRALRLIFDGLPLPLDEDGRAALPGHDLKQLHVLTAEVEFSPLNPVRKDVAYGGEFGSEVSTELTGVPVRARGGRIPPPDKLGSWFMAEGRALPVAAVEEGPALLFVVRAPSPQETARKLARKGSMPADVPAAMRLDKEDQLRFAFPVASRFRAAGEQSDLFEITPPLDSQAGGVPWMLTHVGPLRKVAGGEAPELRIADAVAVAGLEAVAENRRRAVLLVLAGNEKDASGYDPETVRRFLAAIRVPLIVWCLEKSAPGSAAAAWGDCADVSVARSLHKAFGELRQELTSQRIVLVDGRHLPQSIALSPAAEGIELVAGGTPR